MRVYALTVAATALLVVGALLQVYAFGCWRRPLVGQPRTYYDVMDLLYPGEEANVEFMLRLPGTWPPSDPTSQATFVSGQPVYRVQAMPGVRGWWLRTRYLVLVAPFERNRTEDGAR